MARSLVRNLSWWLIVSSAIAGSCALTGLIDYRQVPDPLATLVARHAALLGWTYVTLCLVSLVPPPQYGSKLIHSKLAMTLVRWRPRRGRILYLTTLFGTALVAASSPLRHLSVGWLSYGYELIFWFQCILVWGQVYTIAKSLKSSSKHHQPA